MKQFKLDFHSKRTGAIVAVVVFAVVGSTLLLTSHAATSTTADFEAEAGTVSSPASVVSDSGASGGSAVKFQTASASGCPYPAFPDSSCTGVPAGVTLSAYTGPNPITVNNTVIDGKTFSGGIDIRASGVVIKNSVINGTVAVDDAANYSRANNGTTPVVTIQDSLIDCHAAMGSSGITEAHFIARRVEITRCENGLDMNQDILVEDSYIHNLGDAGSDPHSDGAQCAQGHWNGSTYINGSKNWTLRHNTMFGMSQNDTKFETSAIICGTGTGGGITIDQNLLAGGAYTLYCAYGGPGPTFVVKNNHFTTRFKSTVGAFGPSSDCGDENVSGNVMHETGVPINFAGDF